MRTYLTYVGFFISALILIPSLAFADGNPVVNSFTASATSAQNNYPVALSWSMSNDAGADLAVTCPLGVTVLDNGSSFPCNTRNSLGSADSGSGGFSFVNVSGFNQTITLTLYPKNTDGSDYDAGATSVSISVATSQNPILDFSVSAPNIASGASTALTWTGVDTPATNIVFDCATNVQVFLSGSTTPAPCGANAFSSDEPQSGSITVSAVNSSTFPVTVTAHILPAIASGAYDATHGKAVTFTVAAAVAAAKPSGTSLVVSPTAVTSGNSVILTWATQNAAGANLQFVCGNNVFLNTLVGGATTTVPCNNLGFSPALAANGSVTISAQNQSSIAQTVLVSLLPEDANGNYSGVNAKTASFSILPQGATPQTSTVTPVVQPVTTTAASIPVGATHVVLTLSLARGAQNSQVSALQTFLAQSTALYPEASVTGYFGPATQRAVGRFQIKYGIANPGDQGYGSVGPKTRAKMNSLQTP